MFRLRVNPQLAVTRPVFRGLRPGAWAAEGREEVEIPLQ